MTITIPRQLSGFSSKLVSGVACFVLLAGNLALAQLPGDLGSRFARATITENEKPLLMGTIFKDTSDNLVVMGAPLADLIARAYGVQPFQVVGAPAWVYESHLYDIEAVPPPAALIKSDETQMLRSLLADRFGLRLYRGVREVTMPVLTADWAMQHALRVRTIPGQVAIYALGRAPNWVAVGGPGARYASRSLPILNVGGITHTSVNMGSLVGSLARAMNGPVLDLTGLRAAYIPSGPAIRAIPQNQELMTEALKRSGLTLEQRTVRINVLAVTSIERPRLDVVDR